MPFLVTHIVNSTFASKDTGKDYPSLEEAERTAVHTATDIAKELLSGGHNPSTVEVSLEDAGKVVAKHVVTITTSPLQVH